MEISKIFSFRYDFGKREKGTCINSSGMNAMFDIPYNFRLSVKFSRHIINNTKEKIGSCCTNYFRPIVVLVFAVATALNKFGFRSLRKNTTNLVLGHFDFRLQFCNNKKCIFQGFTRIFLNNGTCNDMT